MDIAVICRRGLTAGGIADRMGVWPTTQLRGEDAWWSEGFPSRARLPLPGRDPLASFSRFRQLVLLHAPASFSQVLSDGRNAINIRCSQLVI